MKSMINFNQLHLLKKSIQILLPISVFSLLFSQPSTLDGLLEVFYNYGSTLSIKLFDYKAERNYAFLLFNGLLALIIKNSGLTTDSLWNSNSRSQTQIMAKAQRSADCVNSSKQKTEAMIHQDGGQNGVVVRDEEEEYDQCDDIPDVCQIPSDDEEEEEEEEVELQRVEELNRKCDDFIRKMRERIKIGSNLQELW